MPKVTVRANWRGRKPYGFDPGAPFPTTFSISCEQCEQRESIERERRRKEKAKEWDERQANEKK